MKAAQSVSRLRSFVQAMLIRLEAPPVDDPGVELDSGNEAALTIAQAVERDAVVRVRDSIVTPPCQIPNFLTLETVQKAALARLTTVGDEGCTE